MNRSALTVLLTAFSLAGATACGAGAGAPGAPEAPTSPDAGPGDSPVANAGEQSSGPSAPDFTLPTLDGGRMSLSDLEGKVVLIDFWSTTCDPCMVEMPHLVEIYKRHKDKGLEVLAISLDGPESRAQVNAMVHDKDMIFPVLLDEETTVVTKFNPKNEMPYAVVINKRGQIIHQRGGYTAGDEKKLEEEIAALLAE